MLKDHFLPDKRRVAQLYREDAGRRVREYQYQIIVLLETCWVSTSTSTVCGSTSANYQIMANIFYRMVVNFS